ncbi:uncharacterized protein B0T23DRAFT_310322 [Neurospora hispaniola]|uniref:Uncharacterized protein n=1 Tax=Neurospora hispaniola TaxID=588809 RepID=A0AAJ0ICD5_9PEZI|nr:hypothetical protein B0T23DRAFT_310322 [Neurospora hispaniola]
MAVKSPDGHRMTPVILPRSVVSDKGMTKQKMMDGARIRAGARAVTQFRAPLDPALAAVSCPVPVLSQQCIIAAPVAR